MPIAPTYPGVYIQEVPSGVRTIVGVSTSTALIIGRCADGPLSTPVRCLSYSEFAAAFSEDGALTELPLQVRQFFLNGGTTAYVMRIAGGAVAATVTLNREDKSAALLLAAAAPGIKGSQIRALVRYDTDQPESTFTLELFRRDTTPAGTQVEALGETWRSLSMNPASPAYAPIYLTQNSKLVTASVPAAPTPNAAFSRAGRPIETDNAKFPPAWNAIVTATSNQFDISVGGGRYVTVTVPVTGITDEATMKSGLATAIKTALAPLPGTSETDLTVTTVAAPPSVFGATEKAKWIQVDHPTQDVFIRPAMTNDVAVPLMLGTAQGGLEKGAYADARPAPTGISVLPAAIMGSANSALASLDPAAVTAVKLDGATPVAFGTPARTGLQTGAGNAAMYRDAFPAGRNGNNSGLQEKLALIVSLVNDTAAADPAFPWTARAWGYRLNFIRRDGQDNDSGSAPDFTGWSPTGAMLDLGPRFYSLGTTGTGAYQSPGVAGDDGAAPADADYSAAYLAADREIDLFNLLVLPAADGVTREPLWGQASVFCLQRRAFLVMDAPLWGSAAAAAAGVDALRVGLVKDHAAVYYPRLTVTIAGLPVQIGASGSIAGLMARTDTARGVWKSPAGTEADIRGISGLERRFSDGENGMLNPKAVNTIRIFPTGVVSWGARTMDGDDASPSDYKYVSIRRLALFLEETLYRGLRWAVFEPNDAPLWGQIRLNVGAFMHGLFTQGAFQGQKSTDAYFVRCDAETTTQDDRNKGIVNVWVGFAPLKPAEFVVLHLQQMAGEIAV
ncbi:phage tail sheath subtilisin-like domain-containing protein [Actinoplanes sp. NEAU-A12]|uniref:Phage tail sheath subtilisin-like domain-containing protein n=1 Tax=Actinoplanes sandaracinus TaxID=3045177 RepID=A0ABT6WWJ0_9ACTN|nr:phage tail sheath subtilisin-like domain-containing protein [Actinoplanes sandaracinus]MDI6104111.1 phage tail sheath subtilisin-like domain-containing protein [Actinoplanes sandaracinus]